jgi:hypothetical protein
MLDHEKLLRSCCLIDARSADEKRKVKFIRPMIHAWLQQQGTRQEKRGMDGVNVLQLQCNTTKRYRQLQTFATNR